MENKIKTYNTVFILYMFIVSISSKATLKSKGSLFLKDSVKDVSLEKNRFFVESSCTKDNCKYPYGECSNENLCTCNYGWAHKKYDSKELCNYSLKNRNWFFIVELFTVIGGGHIYAARYLYGLIKFFAFLILFVLDFIIGRCLFYNRNKPPSIYNFIVYFIYLTLLVFHTYDLVIIATNGYLDGNGMPLIS